MDIHGKSGADASGSTLGTTSQTSHGTHLMASILRRDPGMAVLLLALWAALTGISFLLPRDAFAISPVYARLSHLGIPDVCWGTAWLANAVLLGTTVQCGPAVWRALVAILSAPLWFAFGVLMVAGGAGVGSLSADGLFSVTAAIYLATAATQWANALAPSSSPTHRPAEDDQPWI